MDFKAVLLRAQVKSEQMNPERPNKIGVVNDERKAGHRADKLAYLSTLIGCKGKQGLIV